MLKLVKSSKVMCSILCVLAALSLSACGKKGPLDPPPSSSVSQNAAEPKADAEKPAAKPERSFFLDGLLQ